MTTVDSMRRFEDFISQFVYDPERTRGVGSLVDGLMKMGLEPSAPKAPTGKSEGERLVQRILERDCGYVYSRDYLMEHVFEEMHRNLRFDFYLKRERLVIEFDGDQHYTGSRFHRTREEWLQAIERDELKNRFCRENGISLLRIPQTYVRHPVKLKQLIFSFLERVHGSGGIPIIEVDLYFQLKAGKKVL